MTAVLPPRRVLAQWLVGNQIQQAIYVATKLQIPDLLANGPMRIADLALAARSDRAALDRLLRALASFGIFTEHPPGTFGLTPTANLLRSGVEGSVRAFALWSGGVSYQVFGGLEYSIRTGQPAFDELFGTDFFSYLAAYPEVGASFDELMAWNTAAIAPEIAAYDFTGIQTLVDVGGGTGELLSRILASHASLRGILVDHPRVAERAKRVLADARVVDRSEFVGLDIFQSPLPKGDAYILKSILHGLDDEQAVQLLSNCRQAAGDTVRLLLVEFVMSPGNDPFPGKLMDLLMLIGGRGRERTADEFRELFAAAGCRQTTITPTTLNLSIIEGVSSNR